MDTLSLQTSTIINNDGKVKYKKYISSNGKSQLIEKEFNNYEEYKNFIQNEETKILPLEKFENLFRQKKGIFDELFGDIDRFIDDEENDVDNYYDEDKENDNVIDILSKHTIKFEKFKKEKELLENSIKKLEAIEKEYREHSRNKDAEEVREDIEKLKARLQQVN